MDRAHAESRLKEYLVHGLVPELYQAEEAYALAAEIGRHSAQVNAMGYGQLFAVLQHALSDRQTLSVVKLFEKNSRFPVRSIPAVLRLLDEGAAIWKVREPTALAAVLGTASDTVSDGQVADAACTARVTRHFRVQLDSPRLTAPLRRIRDSRDKVIAHNEAVDPLLRERPTWGDAAVLVEFGKHVAATVAWAYLGLDVTVGGELQLTPDAGRTARALSRLLLESGLTEPGTPAS